jgi:hypothetical protein
MTKATEMTRHELREAARNYDNAINEGGVGYNPYHYEMDRRANKKNVAIAKAHAATPQGKIDALYRRIELECGSVARKWGNKNKIDALQSSLHAEINKIKAEIKAKFLKDWPLDITKLRREVWNKMVKAGKFRQIESGRIDFAILQAQEKSQGWTFVDLKKAVALHDLYKEDLKKSVALHELYKKR